MVVSPCHVQLPSGLDQALAYPGIRLLELTPRIIVESTQLPGTFHRDPADQLIVATARVYTCPLVTVDRKIFGVSPCTNRALAPQKSKIARYARESGR